MADEHLKAVISADSSQLNGELDKAKAKVKEVESASTTATSKSAEGWKALSQGILKAGSSMAIIAKGVESLINIFKQLQQEATEAALRLAKLAIGNAKETGAANYQRMTSAQEDLRRYYELAQKAQGGTSEDEERRFQAEKEFQRKYGALGLDLGADDLKGEISRGLEIAQKKRIEAIEAQVNSYEEASKKLQERIQEINDSKLANLRGKELEQLQSQLTANREYINSLTEQAHELKKENPARDFRALAGARRFDAERKAQEEAQKEREATAAKLAKEREQKGRELLAAQKAYLDAQKREAQAIRELADTERQLARERRAAAIDARRERLQSRMSRFGFSPYEGFDANESNPDRLRRRRQQRLDATIAEKMSRQESGQRVYYTNRERERIGEYEKLQKQDSALQAAQKQMDAADRQRQASETMLRAVNVLSESRNATRLAADGYGQAVTALNSTLQQMLQTTYLVR